MTQPVRYFIDAEFIEGGPYRPIYLISLGVACDDGRELYLQNENAPFELASDWVRANVYPHLLGFDASSLTITDSSHWINFNQFHTELIKFIPEIKPQFWGYYGAYDWVVFAQCFGRLIDLPKGWPMHCWDIKQLVDTLGNVRIPKQPDGVAHHALNDAKWTRGTYNFLKESFHIPGVLGRPHDHTECVLLNHQLFGDIS